MELTPKQSQLCLHYALSHALQEWKQPDATLWRNLEDINHDYPDAPASDYEAALGMVLAERFETLYMDDLVTVIADRYYAHLQLVKEALAPCNTPAQDYQAGDKA